MRCPWAGLYHLWRITDCCSTEKNMAEDSCDMLLLSTIRSVEPVTCHARASRHGNSFEDQVLHMARQRNMPARTRDRRQHGSFIKREALVHGQGTSPSPCLRSLPGIASSSSLDRELEGLVSGYSDDMISLLVVETNLLRQSQADLPVVWFMECQK